MKKLFFLLSLFVALSSTTYPACEASETYFAQIKRDGVYLYSSAINSPEYSLFEIPQTYFVELLDDAGTIFYKARYMESTGYIKKDEIACIRGTPVKPHANSISFRIFATSGLELRSSPSSTSPFNILDTIPFLSTNLIFYGKTYGDESISQKGNLWYYCKYVGGGNSQFGFVYSVFCDSLPTIAINTEVFEEIPAPNFGSNGLPDIKEPITDLFSLPIEAQIAIITGIVLFTGVLLYLIIKPSKLVIKTPTAPPKAPQPKRASKHADYYEFDEFDL